MYFCVEICGVAFKSTDKQFRCAAPRGASRGLINEFANRKQQSSTKTALVHHNVWFNFYGLEFHRLHVERNGTCTLCRIFSLLSE